MALRDIKQVLVLDTKLLNKMNSSDKIYILENIYTQLGIKMDKIVKDSNQILSIDNKITRVRYLDSDNKDCWLAITTETDTSVLDTITKPLTIYTQADIREQQTKYEHKFLSNFINNTDVHCHFEHSDFITKFETFCKITNFLSKILDIKEKNNLCWVLFKWTNPKMCDWHIDGQKTYKVSNILTPTRVTINLGLTKGSYIEVKKADGNIISNKNLADEVFMFDHNQRYHRIILESNYRIGLAFRIRNVDFENILKKVMDFNLVKHIVY